MPVAYLHTAPMTVQSTYSQAPLPHLAMCILCPSLSKKLWRSTFILPWVENSHNSLCHSTTRFTPFLCVLGYQPLFPWNADHTKSPAVDEWFQQSEQVWETNKQFADQHREETPQFNPRERVSLATRDIRGLPGCRNIMPATWPL